MRAAVSNADDVRVDAVRARSGGQILVDALKINKVDHIFCVPGESYLAVLDALHGAADDIRLITCRQEGGAAYMAEAYGKLTGRPGICFVTRGPGATNASIGVHTAAQDSTPMILFVGQVARDQQDREAFQEVDYRQMFGGLAKSVLQIEQAERIPELVGQAFSLASNGRPGPVVVALPEDMLTDIVTAADAGPCRAVSSAASAEDLQAFERLLARASRPLMIVGGGGWTAAAVADLAAFANAAKMPVAASFRCQDLLDNRHASYAGDLGLAVGAGLKTRVRDADVLIAVGARLGEMTTGGYTMVDIPVPRHRFVHVYPGADEIGRVYQPALGIAATMPAFARQLAGLRIDGSAWRNWTEAAHADYLANLVPEAGPGSVQVAEIVTWLSETLPADAIITTGAGNYSGWVHRFYQHKSFRTLLGPTNGSMGYGVPAAIAAKLARPERTVVAFAGDGCFLMNGQELATAIRYGANVVFIILNNGMYGTIRMHQERNYPGRVAGTDLTNPDFAAYARAFGAHGEIVEHTAEFAAAFARARAAGKPAIIEVRTDPEALTPRQTLSQIREAEQKRP